MRKSVIALALVAAACGNAGGGVAATVNGEDIAVSEVQAMRISEAATVDKAVFAADLTDAIINLAVVTAARDEFSIEPTPDEIAAKADEIAGQIEAAQGVSVEDFFASRELPLERLQVIAKQQLIREELYTHFEDQAVPGNDEEARLLLSSDPTGRTRACVRHILVRTQEEANVAKARIDAGEDFATVAGEVGTDGTAADGGNLGCQPLGLYVAEFSTAAFEADLGVVTEPVQSEFGWHLILVESREEPSLEELKEEILDGRVNQLVDAWLIDTVSDATVEVGEEYGVWVTEPTPQVQAPGS
ncbi:MAG TPA: peptidylprolyl isomerase [Acidimicrobiia bacterium]|nr:peptidylprolyl isomerase [Acidimicrobiia bacterium]